MHSATWRPCSHGLVPGARSCEFLTPPPPASVCGLVAVYLEPQEDAISLITALLDEDEEGAGEEGRGAMRGGWPPVRLPVTPLSPFPTPMCPPRVARRPGHSGCCGWTGGRVHHAPHGDRELQGQGAGWSLGRKGLGRGKWTCVTQTHTPFVACVVPWCPSCGSVGWVAGQVHPSSAYGGLSGSFRTIFQQGRLCGGGGPGVCG